MKFTTLKHPYDIFICFFWNILLLPITLFSTNILLKSIFGLPFLLFIPGYILLLVLFPQKKNIKGIDGMERIALSFGLSLVIVPFLAFILNYSPWGIQLETIFFVIFLFIITMSIIAFIRRKKTDPIQRFIISFEINLQKTNNRINAILVLIIVISIIITFSTIIYLINNSRNKEPFTEFYLLGPTGKTTEYPHNLTLGENASVIIGLTNHEYKTMNYTIEVWLINQTINFNESTQLYDSTYVHMWFMNKFFISLNNSFISDEKEWKKQWEYNYTFNIKRRGEYKLTFLLFVEPTQEYKLNEEYKQIAKQKIENAYEQIYLLLHIF